MTATVTKSPTKRTTNIDWNLVESLHSQGFLPKAIQAKTGVNSRTISVHLSRHKVNRGNAVTVTNTDVEAVGKQTRAKIAAEVERTVDKLAKNDPKRPEMLNLHADTLQKAAKTAALVHGWGDGVQVAVIVAGDIGGQAVDDDEPEAIDVETATERQQDGPE